MGKRIKIPLSGGNWDNGSNAGLFCRNLNNASSNSNSNVGGSDSDTRLKTSNSKVDHRDALSSDKRNRAVASNLSSDAEHLTCSLKTKRKGFLYEKTFSKKALYQAYVNARKGKRKKVDCFEFELKLGAEINSLHSELLDGYYKPMPLKKFEIFEPKKRTIHTPHFRDLVVQHAIYQVIYPIFDVTFIDQSYACRKGGGTHKASDIFKRR